MFFFIYQFFCVYKIGAKNNKDVALYKAITRVLVLLKKKKAFNFDTVQSTGKGVAQYL